MTWGRTLDKALNSASVPAVLSKWRDLTARRGQWRVLCGAKSSGRPTNPRPTNPRDIWTQVVNGTAPAPQAPTASPQRAQCRQPRSPAPVPALLSVNQQ